MCNAVHAHKDKMFMTIFYSMQVESNVIGNCKTSGTSGQSTSLHSGRLIFTFHAVSGCDECKYI